MVCAHKKRSIFQEYYAIMIKRVVQPAAGEKSLKIQCAIRKMRSFGPNCLFYFCIDYFLHFSRRGADNYRGCNFLRRVQISLRGVRTPH